MPRLDKLSANIDFDQHLVRLREFELFVEDQPIHATGELPLGNDFSVPLKKFVDWKQVSARVQINQAQIAPFAPFFPRGCATRR